MVFAMSQANVVFPMAAIGLDVGGILLTSILGGLVAASSTYYLFTRSLASDSISETLEITRDKKTGTIFLLIAGGQDAIDFVLESVPIILIAILVVNCRQEIPAA